MNQKPDKTSEGREEEAADKAMPGGVIRVDEGMIKSHLDKVVVSTVEQGSVRQVSHILRSI